ncbi:agmatinase [Halobacteriovorax marinus]|uniref:agmatinase n=1 Tax=Halobacteriovorax marinus TaxID=97084 RepID=UPI0002F8EE7E|nr:agmatinase [Halobacteriovorax marinus]
MSTEIIKDSLPKLQRPEEVYLNSHWTDKLHANATHLIGFGFDGTACFRKGTKDGPDALRIISDGIEDYSPYLKSGTDEIRKFYDLGNLNVGTSDDADANWKQATDEFLEIFSDVDLKESGIKTLTLGGEHSISFAPLKTYLDQYDDLVVIHLDAHADLRDGYLGHHYSHASIIRRALDHFKDGHELIQYGIRSGTKDEFNWMHEHGTIKTSRADFLEAVSSIANDRPIYLTFDLDYFDPSFFPGTGTPEPGGEDFHSFISFVKILMNKNFVGCDVVELSPVIDPTGNSDVFAAKVVRELLIALN